MTPERLVIVAILLTVAGAVIAAAISQWRTVAGWFAFIITGGSAALVATAAFRVLLYGPSGKPERLLPMPQIGSVLHIAVDGLTALYLILGAMVAATASLHAVAYMRRYTDYSLARYYPHTLLFVGGIYGLLSTTDMMWFLFVFWQMMTIPGYFLIRFEHRERANVRAANRYMWMMQLGCAATMLGAEILVQGSRVAASGELRFSFAAVSQGIPGLLAEKPALVWLAFACFLIGFGIKAGMWPFGAVWLPEAHPAPSPVSAVLSGVMIKTGVYGLIRYFLCLVPSEARADFGLQTWGSVVAVLGTITLVTGTSSALRQDYSKRLLAFHSIGQVGYILLACGVCMVLIDSKVPGALPTAALALMAALLHSLNHGVFKALLFLNAGSMLHRTETQNLNRMGGLWKYMPLTAATALVASLSISGFPLLNGFVSKWMVYVSALQGRTDAPFLAICAAMALMTSALTLASFVKFFGSAFLGRASTLVEEHAKRTGRMEVSWIMQVPQVVLAVTCVGTGVFPRTIVWLGQNAIAGTKEGIVQRVAGVTALGRGAGFGLRSAMDSASYAPLALLGILAAMLFLAWWISRLGGARRRADAPWLCGYVMSGEDVRYTAHGYYGEMKRPRGRSTREASHGGS